jgi:hypothetical protein
VELDRTTKQLKEAISIAGEETAKCKAAKEVIKSLTAQVSLLTVWACNFVSIFMPTCNFIRIISILAFRIKSVELGCPILNSSMLVCYNQDTKLE